MKTLAEGPLSAKWSLEGDGRGFKVLALNPLGSRGRK